MRQLTNLQEKLLNMFASFHAFCVNNNLRYYALGGTMLGAIRHRGFIPWDDDIDVGMPREDYKRLCELLQNKKIENRYILETPNSCDPNFLYPYFKLYDTTTTLIENTKNILVRGIFIDIFPLDGLGDTKSECYANYSKISYRINLLKLRNVKIRKERNLLKNILLFLIQIPSRPFIYDKEICHKIDSICQRYSLDEKVYGGNLLGAWGLKEVMPVSVFGTPKLYDFENIHIYGVQHADEYLTRQYGNWRKLPPIEKQITHHDYFLDVNHAYSTFHGYR